MECKFVALILLFLVVQFDDADSTRKNRYRGSESSTDARDGRPAAMMTMMRKMMDGSGPEGQEGAARQKRVFDSIEHKSDFGLFGYDYDDDDPIFDNYKKKSSRSAD